MGNQCEQCEQVTQGCKRQQFRQQLKNRQKLDLSRAYGYDKSKSKFDTLSDFKNIPLIQAAKNNILQNSVQNQESIQYAQKIKPPPKDTTSINKRQQILKNLASSQSNRFNEAQIQQRKMNGRTSSLQQINNDFRNIKLPIQSGYKSKNVARLQELENQLNGNNKNQSKQSNRKYAKQHRVSDIKDSSTNSNRQRNFYINNFNASTDNNNLINKKSLNNGRKLPKIQNNIPALLNNKSQHNNNIHIVQDPIKQSKFQEEYYIQNQSKIEIQSTTGMNEEHKNIKEKNNHISIKQNHREGRQSVHNNNVNKSFLKQNQNKSASKYEKQYISGNPSKVLKQFNRQLQLKDSHKNYSQQYQNQRQNQNQQQFSQTQNIQPVQQHHYYLKPGIYFNGFISTVDKTVHNKGAVRIQNDGTQIVAYFKKGTLNLRQPVTVNFSDDSYFEGNVQGQNFTTSGSGKFIFADESFYMGEWLKNLPHGKGKHKFSDGSQYQGEFIQGRKQGFGKFCTSSEDLIYQGSFLNNKIQGKGIMQIVQPNTSKKRVYIGYFKNGKLQGPQCEVQYINEKAKYIGSFSQGQKNGKGKYDYGDGRTWQGEWKNNRQNGYGRYKNLKGNVIEGYWMDGIKIEDKLHIN